MTCTSTDCERAIKEANREAAMLRESNEALADLLRRPIADIKKLREVKG